MPWSSHANTKLSLPKQAAAAGIRIASSSPHRPDGFAESCQYDLAGRLTAETDYTGATTAFTPGEHTNLHPRTGLPDRNRIGSEDGTRSIRLGNHEMSSEPTKFHYHEETWT
ncbi:hypothetical protein ACFQ9R_03790 [Nocardia sp. NPDC056541]|uniref:hypothetical protein n=1 Tax=Nocardia sp. NPDC056541 TaxID=3345860 RepID=UPI003670A1E9